MTARAFDPRVTWFRPDHARPTFALLPSLCVTADKPRFGVRSWFDRLDPPADNPGSASRRIRFVGYAGWWRAWICVAG